MAYRFKLNEPIRNGFLRIGVEQIDRAERQLIQSRDHDRSIHETRKCLKRVRALLRLVRPGLEDKDYRHSNGLFRQIGAQLSEARDNQIMLQTITRLETQGMRAPLQGLKRLLLEERNCGTSGIDPGLTAAAVAGLGQARQHFETLKVSQSSFKTLRRGLERSYGHGRRASAIAFSEPSDEAFHELRKGAQRHWRHMKLLAPAWPEFCEARVAAARELSQILGDDHDLAVLKMFLKRVRTEEIGPAEARVIRRAIRERQNELREAARPRAKRLFAERPKDFGRHLESLWSSAQHIREEDRGEQNDTRSPRAKTSRTTAGPNSPVAAARPIR